MGREQQLFHQGVAHETKDDDVIVAAMKKPGVVLQRPVGSDKPFKEHSELPTAASLTPWHGTPEPSPSRKAQQGTNSTRKPLTRLLPHTRKKGSGKKRSA